MLITHQEDVVPHVVVSKLDVADLLNQYRILGWRECAVTIGEVSVFFILAKPPES